MDSICYSCKGIVQNHAYVGKKSALRKQFYPTGICVLHTFLITMKCCIFFINFVLAQLKKC